METRKLQKVGGGTLTVSIPKDWADEHGLEASAPVHLYPQRNGSIVVRTADTDGDNLSSARLELDGSGPGLVERALRAAYAVGFQSITLVPASGRAFTTGERRAARSVTRGLVGTEIRVEHDRELTVRNLLDASDVSVRQSVVQLQFVALSIHRRATAALLDDETATCERLRERDDETDRLFEMVARYLHRSLVSLEEVDRLGTIRSALFDYYVTARQLERVADLGIEVARASERLREPLPPAVADDVRRVADASREVVESASGAVLDGASVDDVQEPFDLRDEALAEIAALDAALFDESETPLDGSPTTARVLGRVLYCFGRTAECGGNAADVALRSAVRNDCL